MDGIKIWMDGNKTATAKWKMKCQRPTYTDPTEEETDEPIVSVDVAVGGGDAECDDMAVDNSIHTLLVKAQQRSCKASGHGCVQIRVAD